MNAKLLASIVGLLLVAIPSETESICPCNTTSTQCAPCDQFCNEEARFCALYCIEGQNYCGCSPGYLRYNRKSSFCVLKKDCPPL